MLKRFFFLVSLVAADISLTKTDMRKAYQAGECCGELNEFTASCVANVSDITMGGQILYDHYKDAGCCEDDDCTVTLESCPLCTDTALDLYRHMIGVEQTYTLGVTSLVITHYPDYITSYDPVAQTNTSDPNGIDDFVVIRHPTETDPSFVVRSFDYYKDLLHEYGCMHNLHYYVVDYVDTWKECTDMIATFYMEADTQEILDQCMDLMQLLAGTDYESSVRTFGLKFAFDWKVTSAC